MRTSGCKGAATGTSAVRSRVAQSCSHHYNAVIGPPARNKWRSIICSDLKMLPYDFGAKHSEAVSRCVNGSSAPLSNFPKMINF